MKVSRRFRTIAAAFFVAVLAAGAFAQDLPKIAVYVTGDVSDNEKKALGTRMLASLVNSGRYRGIERASSFIAEIEKEQVKQRSGAIDDNQISALGKQFGVKYVCIADITPVFGSFQVSARIVDVETAEVAFIGESYSQLKTVVDLVTVSDQVVRNMFGGQTATFRKQKTEPPPEATKPEPPKPEPPKPEPPKPEPPKPEPPKTYTLTVNAAPANGGTVSRSPNYAYYIAGTQVTVTAAPAYGYTFDGWSGASLSTSASLIVTMSGDAALTARFSRLPPPKPEPRPPKPAPPPAPAVVSRAKDAPPKPAPERKPKRRASVGGGLLLLNAEGGGISRSEWIASDLSGMNELPMPYNAVGAYAFLDAAYAEASVGFSTGGGALQIESNESLYRGNMSRTYLNVGVHAKYPIDVGTLRVFPLVGFDYEAAVSAGIKDSYGEYHRFNGQDDYPNASALSALWVKFGVGVDVYTGKNRYLRAEMLYGVRTANAFEKHEAELLTSTPASVMETTGYTLKIGFGFHY